MKQYKCPICDIMIELADKIKPGQRLTCPNCFAQLALYKYRGKIVIGCAICKEAIFNPDNCEDCSRRQEKKKLLEEGRL